ncbi:MAG TPA: OmpA family protein [Polyangiaceae bacterium]|nr:OmpA family protein [Polyangiaceae bacterium]
MLKKTGAGKILESTAVPIGGVRASLYNYDIDGSEPKPEHVAFLNARVLPVLTGKDARCWLQGSASKTGTDAHNMQLSQKRVEGVRNFLVSRGVSPTRIVSSFVGESLASLKVAEAEGDRAVALLCAPLLSPPPPPPPPAPAGPKRATRFRIRELGGISGGAGIITFDSLYFQIWDFTNNVTTFYNYRAGGFGKGAKGGPPLSATLEGPWNDFSTTGPLATDEFGGAARFTTAGGAKWSINFVNFMSLPRGLKTNPNPLEISTGFTVGVGVSTSVGEMSLGPTYPFTGP